MAEREDRARRESRSRQALCSAGCPSSGGRERASGESAALRRVGVEVSQNSSGRVSSSLQLRAVQASPAEGPASSRQFNLASPTPRCGRGGALNGSQPIRSHTQLRGPCDNGFGVPPATEIYSTSFKVFRITIMRIWQFLPARARRSHLRPSFQPSLATYETIPNRPG